MKKLVYDKFVVSVDEPYVAWEVVRKIGQPVKLKGFRNDEIKNIRELDQQWECWTLSGDDIRVVAERNGINPKDISDEQLEEIARTFKKDMEWACEDWVEWLAEAIRQHVSKGDKSSSNRKT